MASFRQLSVGAACCKVISCFIKFTALTWWTVLIDMYSVYLALLESADYWSVCMHCVLKWQCSILCHFSIYKRNWAGTFWLCVLELRLIDKCSLTQLLPYHKCNPFLGQGWDNFVYPHTAAVTYKPRSDFLSSIEYVICTCILSAVS